MDRWPPSIALKYLLQLYRTGSGSALAPQQDKAKRLLTDHAAAFTPGEKAFQSLLLESGEGSGMATVERLGSYYAGLVASDRRRALETLFERNQNAYTYVLQQELARRGLYEGRANGLMTAPTISAIARACSSLRKWSDCSGGPLTPAALAVMAEYLLEQG